MAYEIEKNIPPPAAGNKTKYPFGAMAIGDSFLVDQIEGHKLRAAAYEYGKRHNIHFIIRAMDDGQVRCWRVKTK